MPRRVLYPFQYYDLRTRKWWRARYVCDLWEIAERYAAFKIIGHPEIREFDVDSRIVSDAHRRS